MLGTGAFVALILLLSGTGFPPATPIGAQLMKKLTPVILVEAVEPCLT